MLMGIALVTAERGTCSRLQVGAVFSKDGRILVNGYNGTAKGQPHCDHTCDCGMSVDWYQVEHAEDCASGPLRCQAQHAERNAIDFAAKHGLELEGSDLHVTHMPCIICAGSLLNVGVQTVSYLNAYRLTEGVELLERTGVRVIAMTPWKS
jgi:dCMP deaminase